MGNKLNIEFIRKEFNKEGYKLLSTEYVNNTQKLEYKCPRGHLWSITWTGWRTGNRCPYCSNKIKKDIEFIRKEFNKDGYELLSTDYINNKSKLKYKCNKGHIGYTTWKNWDIGRRCFICYKKTMNKREKLDFNFIKNNFEEYKYKLLSIEYIDSTSKLKYQCPKGHIGYITWSKWQQGERCGYCANNKRLNIEFIEKKFKSYNYKLLSKNYINSKSELIYKCQKNHINRTTWNNFQQGKRCPTCAYLSSNSENELSDYLKYYFNDLIKNDRNLIKPYELDILITSKNIAIEYCGLYWHSSIYKDNNYHLKKLNECNKKDYKLITIFEDEWIHKKDIVLSLLQSKLNIDDLNKVYARKCIISELTSKECSNFLDKNHLQGKGNSSIKLGAYYNNELISVMTFSKGNIAKGSKLYPLTYELDRFCSKINYRVIGIASKLLKYFLRKYEYNEIYSYSDKRWSDGNLYKKLGFKFSHSSNPNYWYISNNKRIHRFNFRKSVLKDKIEFYNSEITEYENMKLNGYNRIFDCGNDKWVLYK